MLVQNGYILKDKATGQFLRVVCADDESFVTTDTRWEKDFVVNGSARGRWSTKITNLRIFDNWDEAKGNSLELRGLELASSDPMWKPNEEDLVDDGTKEFTLELAEYRKFEAIVRAYDAHGAWDAAFETWNDGGFDNTIRRSQPELCYADLIGD